MTTPNLFDYATKELSQDAVICWLIQWAACKDDPGLQRLGRDFVERLLNHKSEAELIHLGDVTEAKVARQDHRIDVLARINGKHVLLIEDKTDSQPHSDQLKRYRDAVLRGETSLGAVEARDLHAIYFKTGNYSMASERQIEADSPYRVFGRQDFLAVLERYSGSNAIATDYSRRLRHLERLSQGFRHWRSDDEHQGWAAYEGLFRELEERLFSGAKRSQWWGWGYVPNASGGFMGFWWRPQGLPPDSPAYLQLELDKLCFKVGAEGGASAEKQEELKRDWNARITSQHEAAVRPRVLRRGSSMTVAVWDRGWLRFGTDGSLDLDATTNTLAEAEQALLAAART